MYFLFRFWKQHYTFIVNVLKVFHFCSLNFLAIATILIIILLFTEHFYSVGGGDDARLQCLQPWRWRSGRWPLGSASVVPRYRGVPRGSRRWRCGGGEEGEGNAAAVLGTRRCRTVARAETVLSSHRRQYRIVGCTLCVCIARVFVPYVRPSVRPSSVV